MFIDRDRNKITYLIFVPFVLH
ncbi:BgTH12-03848 [Blumeria graminis f. sp. triticale]|uniref:BgTH12-03848 n=1 Tax=Blumeria graminis f. sp. triticale TaxID=1689686 RepID=A0A9W4D1S9_BLUGR|nr:BgTH12-03848 [Blumeria graminis f. sp. triticale]